MRPVTKQAAHDAARGLITDINSVDMLIELACRTLIMKIDCSLSGREIEAVIQEVIHEVKK